MERTENTNKLLLASKAWEGSGSEHGPIFKRRVSAEESAADAKKDFHRSLIVGGIFAFLILLVGFSAWLFQPQINMWCGRYKVPVEVKIP